MAAAALLVLALPTPARADWVSVINDDPVIDAPVLAVVQTACISSGRQYGFPINKGELQTGYFQPRSRYNWETPTHCFDKSKVGSAFFGALRDVLPSFVNLDITNYWRAVILFVKNGNLNVAMYPPPRIGIPLDGNMNSKLRWSPVPYFNAMTVISNQTMPGGCHGAEYCLQNGDSHSGYYYVEPFITVPFGGDFLAALDKIPGVPDAMKKILNVNFVAPPQSSTNTWEKLVGQQHTIPCPSAAPRLPCRIGARASCVKTNLARAQLVGANLFSSNFYFGQLCSANLQKANLSQSNFQGATLQSANLENANLIGAYMQQADLLHAYLQGANLSDANLQGAGLEYANLHGAYLQRTQMIQAYMFRTELTNTDMTAANLQNANLQGANLDTARLVDANLTGADLTQANLHNADLKGATLVGAKLDDATLTGAMWPDGHTCGAGSIGVCR